MMYGAHIVGVDADAAIVPNVLFPCNTHDTYSSIIIATTQWKCLAVSRITFFFIDLRLPCTYNTTHNKKDSSA